MISATITYTIIMDSLPPELQSLIYTLLHKILMEEVLKDMADTRNRSNKERAKLYEDEIIKMMENSGYRGNRMIIEHPLHKKIDREIHRQSFIDSGKWSLEQIEILMRH